MEWISANIANIIVFSVVMVIIILALRGIIQAKKAGCNGQCIGCSVAHLCHSNSKNDENPIVKAYHQTYKK